MEEALDLSSDRILNEYMIISCSVFLRMRNISEESSAEIENMVYVQLRFFENHAVYEKNVEKY